MSAQATKTAIREARRASLPKAPTGIQGLDEVTGGGLPRGRPTLVCGGPGCGKTLLALEFLVRGATEFGEPGVFMAFEETADELAQNSRSLGFDLDELAGQGKLLVDYVRVERSEIEETGEYDLDGLFIRLGHAIDSVRARRVVFDSIETLFGGFANAAILRAELRRLFAFLKEKGMTALITGERGEGTLTRHGLEEYVSDCVIVLDHRVIEQVSTRRLRIVKYRGTSHGTNEYPFMIDEHGISVLPITSLGLAQEASDARISTGVPRLDTMLGGQGVYRGSSVLVSGTAGTGKTSLAGHFVDAACRRGERCLFFAFEESESQLLRNLRSIGLDLAPWSKKGLLHIYSTRPTAYGLETHLVALHKQVAAFRPGVVVIDPISSLTGVGTTREAESLVTRMVDFLKSQGITGLYTSLTQGATLETSQASISSLIDTWILLRDIELGGERNRGLCVLKSRGTHHSNQIREFLLTDHGIELLDVCVGPEGVLTGSMRQAQEARERATALNRQQEIESRRRGLERKRKALDAQIRALRAEFEAEQNEMRQMIVRGEAIGESIREGREQMARRRHADEPGSAPKRPRKASFGGSRK